MVSQKIVYVFGAALIGLATTFAINDFQYSQEYNYYAATASQIFGVTQLAAERARVVPPPPANRGGFQLKLREGWNLLGTAGSPAGLNDIKGCKFDGPAFGYDGEQYFETGRLEVGRGYWVYVLNDCLAELPGAIASQPKTQPDTANNNGGALPQDELMRIKERLYNEQRPTTGITTNEYDLMKQKLLKEYESTRTNSSASGDTSAPTDNNLTDLNNL